MTVDSSFRWPAHGGRQYCELPASLRSCHPEFRSCPVRGWCGGRFASGQPSSRRISSVCSPSSGGGRSCESGASLEAHRRLPPAARCPPTGCGDLDQHPAMLDLLVGEHLRHGVDRAARHARARRSARTQSSRSRLRRAARRSAASAIGLLRTRPALVAKRSSWPCRAARAPRRTWRTGRRCRPPARRGRRRMANTSCGWMFGWRLPARCGARPETR